MKKTFLLAIALLCFCAPMSLFAQKQLAFKDGKFKIVQFTDIHWDQKSSKCAKTVATIRIKGGKSGCGDADGRRGDSKSRFGRMEVSDRDL